MLSTKDVSSLFVSEITDLGQFTSISEPSKATSKASSKGSDIFLDEIIFTRSIKKKNDDGVKRVFAGTGY